MAYVVAKFHHIKDAQHTKHKNGTGGNKTDVRNDFLHELCFFPFHSKSPILSIDDSYFTTLFGNCQAKKRND